MLPRVKTLYLLEKKLFNYKPYTRLFFNSFMRHGKKKKLTRYIRKIATLLKMKYKIKKKIIFFLAFYFKQIFFNMRPLIYFKYKHVRGFREELPWLPINTKRQIKKYRSLVVIWMRRSIKLRKEKSLFLRMYCELNDIRLNRGNSILAKKNILFEFL